MCEPSESVQETIRRRLDVLLAAPPATADELLVGVLEALRDVCLELPEIALGSDPLRVEHLLRPANQMILGLLYHVGDAGAGASLAALQRQLETRLRELRTEQEQAAALKHRLRILDTDLNTLREQRRLLEAIAEYEQVRDRLQAQHRDAAAYQQLLAGAAQRATRERSVLEELGRQVETLLAQQRQLLREELQGEQAEWQAVEREVFGA